MKVVGRILYAFSVAIFLVFIHNAGTRFTADKYLNNEGLKMFESESQDRYRMFYGSTGFHRDEPTYRFVSNGYQVQFFEINKVFVNKAGDVKVEEYYYVMIDHPTHVLETENPQKYYMVFESNGEPFTLRIHQFRNIPFSVVVDQNDEGLLVAQELIDLNVDTIKIIEYVDEVSTVIASSSMTFINDDLYIKEIVSEHYNDHDYLVTKGIYPKYIVDSSKYNYIYWLFITGYIVLVAGMTYWLFFYKNPKKYVKPPTFE